MLVTYVNNNISEFGRKIDALDDLKDGASLIMLIGMVGQFFVPFKTFHLEPASDSEIKQNLDLVLILLQELEIDAGKVSVNDILEGNARTISRCVFLLYQVAQI